MPELPAIEPFDLTKFKEFEGYEDTTLTMLRRRAVIKSLRVRAFTGEFGSPDYVTLTLEADWRGYGLFRTQHTLPVDMLDIWLKPTLEYLAAAAKQFVMNEIAKRPAFHNARWN